MSTELTTIEPAQLQAAFANAEAIDHMLAKVETAARAHQPDTRTATGRKAIASVAYQVARSKTAFDDAGKALTEAMRKQISSVDAERRRIRDRLDALKDEVRAPLTEWEQAEAARVEAIKDRIAGLHVPMHGADATTIKARIAEVETVAINDSWAEFVADAAKAKDAALADLRQALDAALWREEQARREEAERARMAAEAEARRVAEEAEREAKRAAQIEAEKQAAVEAAERRARETAEREAAEKIRDVEARMQRELEAAARAKAEAEAAAKREADRREAEAKAQADADARRAADTKHRTIVRDRIAAAVEPMIGNASVACDVADALMAGKIPHVEVRL